MIPFIKLIYDPTCNWWVCGDESGKLLIATAEFIKSQSGIDSLPVAIGLDSATSRWQSDILAGIAIPDGTITYVVPSDESLIDEIIDIIKCAVGRYIVHAGFSSKHSLWIFHDRLYPNPDFIPATLADLAKIDFNEC